MANGHFLLFILRQREKSAISVRKKHKFQTENKTLHKMFGKRLTAAEKYGTIKCTQTARDVQSGKSAKGRKRHDEVQGCCYDGFSFFPGTSSCRSAPFRGLNRRRSFVCLTAKEVSTFMKKVAVIMGSDSDLPVLKGAFEQLKKLGIPFEAHVYSAHRTPAEAAAFAASARESGFGVLIAAAGKAAHLAGALAAQTTLPVIGIPVKSSTRCYPPCRCPAGCLWRRLPSTVRRMRRCSRRRFLRSRTKPWRKSCWRCARRSMTRSSPRTRRWLLNNTKHEHSKFASINCCGRQP